MSEPATAGRSGEPPDGAGPRGGEPGEPGATLRARLGHGRARWSLPFGALEALSFVHSGVYSVVLWFFVTDTESPLRAVAAWTHGWGWILMSLLVIQAVRARVLPLWLAVSVAVLGGIGPFVGTAGFVVEHRRRRRAAATPRRD